MQLLIDTFEPTGPVVAEAMMVRNMTETAEGGEKKYFIEGIFAQAEQRNRNGRIYPKSVMEKAIKSFMPAITAKRALGELNHPTHPNVNPERASHLIESLRWEGNNVIGRAKVLTSLPQGKIVKGLIDEGVSFGVSTRGLGSITEKAGTKYVQDDFVLNTIDVVGDPSAPDAWVEAVLENKDWVYDVSSNAWILAERVKTQIKQVSSKQLQEQKLAIFAKFLSDIR